MRWRETERGGGREGGRGGERDREIQREREREREREGEGEREGSKREGDCLSTRGCPIAGRSKKNEILKKH